MQPVLTTSQSREFDRYLIEDIGIPSLVLMENAAQGVLEAMEDWLEALHDVEIAVLCGTGNNGGDGLAVARLLIERKLNVTVLLCGDKNKLSRDAKTQLNILSKLLEPDEVYVAETSEEILEIVDAPDIIIDALLGTGTTGEPRGAIREAIEAILLLAPTAKVLAVDIPSGMDSDAGASRESDLVVSADRTVTMGAPKIGFFQGKSKEYTGDIFVAQLGAPYPDAILKAKGGAFLIDEDDVAPLIPEFETTASKVTRGRVLGICGSRGMTGAAIMSAEAALRTGCGWVNVAVPKSERSLVAQAMPELLTVGLTEEDGSPTTEAWEDLAEHLQKADAMLIGSGLRPLEGTAELMRKIITDVDLPLVIDAGALGALVDHLDLLKARKAPSILTPHTGEIARLVGRPWQDVEPERLGVAREIATKYNSIVVMKGAPTYTVAQDGTAYINTTGNVGLATAGSGDVLAGMIVSLIVQQPETVLDDVIASVFLHGLAGDLAAKEKTTHSMTATDIIRMLPGAFREMGVE